MMYRITVQLMILALSVRISSSQELNSTLHLTEYGVPYAFVDETITFTCRTERSNSIGWSSKEYIGVNRLDFASVEPDGTTRPPTENGAVAQLISSSQVNGIVTLVSQLQITVQSEYQVASVTCHNIGIDTFNTFSFRMADNTLITCDVPAICPGEIVSCTCITAHSNTLAWNSDQLIGEGGAELVLNLNDPLLARQNASNMNTFAVLSNTSDENGVLVLKSELSFVLLSTSFSIILTCENIDDQNSHSVILPIYTEEECHTVTPDPTTTTDESITTTTFERPPTSTLSDTGLVNVISGLTVVIVLLIIIIIVLMVYCYWKIYRNGTKRTGISLKHKELEEMTVRLPATKDDASPCDGQKPVTTSTQGLMYHKEQEDEAHVSDDSPLKSATMLFKSMKGEEQVYDLKGKRNLDMCKTFFKRQVQQLTEELQEGKYAHEQLKEQVQKILCKIDQVLDQEEAELQKIKNEMYTQKCTQKQQQMELLQVIQCEMKELLKRIQCEMEQRKERVQKIESEMEEERAKLEIDMEQKENQFPVQASVANEAVEANMAGNRDCPHMATTGNLRRSSVTDSESRHPTEAQ